ncbi:bifunctional AP-4-A phosphorylase/ADP sulfurylase NDAI_0F04610 [Naumovozyma dairenensis CBS 421]|uniref:Uncharacterized protein n=1 Tax=Naumovozyma dairenensis (strain ATCC 10597 / BCRC 20456 / CBS 421 / NBRC 0211 / NRRL Y-12639) TaxID=1071378 RepID=G0WDB8_NAUDC|nr:hypothetical protein NDAI_0F04610 [Naumovozyma dairenensis CBS 421]CCD25779.1 hypothetical protein NDAI_0F04610 [Naumovozyma dairenensis CBS 421]
MVQDNIKQLIHEKYEKAIQSGTLKLAETTSKKIKDLKSGIQCLVTLAPNLKKKQSNDSTEKDDSIDPFINPNPDVVISDDLNNDGDYQLLLNKFPIIPEHSILTTKEFQSQTSALTPKDLLTTYQLLCKLDADDEDEEEFTSRHLAFYNSGAHSGSSQDHKHLQIVELPSKLIPFQQSLCNGKEHFLPTFNSEPLQDDKISFAHFVLPLPESSEDVNEDLLAMCYISLLQRTLTFFQDWTNERPNLSKSYNVLLTKNWICLIPRSNATAEIKQTPEDSEEIDLKLSINSLGYVGMILTKDEKEFNQIVSNPQIVDELLLSCGFPNTFGQKPTEYHY